MANMDYTPVKYIIHCMENFYPECLAAIILHKAPWFFLGTLFDIRLNLISC